ncbi:MAG: DUF4340 domain-containing protein [Ignavibacteria bacterium]|nr:DUF4340 domain-containing protein [Ignavibacteria bacterium]
MFRKANNKILGLLFAALLIIVLVVFLFDTGKNERTFREVLVDIDSSAVTEILIYPKAYNHKEVKIFKDNSQWMVLLSSGKSVPASTDNITNLFMQLAEIKPKRLAARGEDKWNEFQVDSTGTRVKIIEGTDVTLDLIIGRFSFQQPRTMNSFVRLFNDTDVYEVDGFLDMTFNQNENAFRDGTIINGSYENWQSVSFNYPADSSFTLSKTGNLWSSDKGPVDSAKVVNYLSRLSQLTNNNFVDNVSIDENSQPIFSLSITTAELAFITINGYQMNNTYFINSSLNPEAYFDGNSVGKSIFTGYSNFAR